MSAYRARAAHTSVVSQAPGVTAILLSVDRAEAPVQLPTRTVQGLDRLQGRVAQTLRPQSHSVQDLYTQYTPLLVSRLMDPIVDTVDARVWELVGPLRSLTRMSRRPTRESPRFGQDHYKEQIPTAVRDRLQ